MKESFQSDALRELQNETRRLKNQLTQVQHENAEHKANETMLKARLSRLNLLRTTLSQHCKQNEQEAENLRLALRDKHSLDLICGEQERMIGKLTEEKNHLFAEIHQREQTINSLNERLGRLESKEQVEKFDFESKLATIAKQENRLKNYANSLNKMNLKLVQACAQLAREIQSAKTLHPLRDYLKLTEREIIELEGILKVTPLQASERESQKLAMKQLLEQREFLTQLIRASEEELKQQATVVEQIARQSSRSTAPPPPPPQTKTKPEFSEG